MEEYALYVGIKMSYTKRIKNLIICGDSMLVIRAIVKRNITRGDIYSGIMSRSLDALKRFEKITFYHIKLELNVEVENFAKVGSRSGKGNLVNNGELRLYPLL
jgi:hypothetical protein